MLFAQRTPDYLHEATMTCRCRERPVAFTFYPDSDPVEPFRDSLREVERDGRRGLTIGQCQSCGTWWYVDWGTARWDYAIKLDRLKRLAETDVIPYERQMLIEIEGGLGDQKCQWAGCENRVLKGAVICVDHAHPHLLEGRT
jgi:hypothetical protein